MRSKAAQLRTLLNSPNNACRSTAQKTTGHTTPLFRCRPARASTRFSNSSVICSSQMPPEERILHHPFTHQPGWLLLVTVLLSASGATCQRQFMTNPFAAAGPAAPQVLMEGATRDQIVAAVN